MNTNLSSRLYYPDPFQPTGIAFTLEEPAVVTVRIIDGSGKEAETLIEGRSYSAGGHLLIFDPAKYKDGEHWYQITAKTGDRNLTDTKKIL